MLEPTHQDLLLDVKQITRDRSISEDMASEEQIEELLLELEKSTHGRVNIRQTWDYICSRCEAENEQFTKLYSPKELQHQFIDQTKAGTTDSIGKVNFITDSKWILDSGK